MIDLVVNDPRTREMYLRRLRTLMDEQLQPPGTPVAERHFESRIDDLVPTITREAALDIRKWGAIYGIIRTFPTALALLKTNYLDERRVYLYQTHAAGASAGSGRVPGAPPERDTAGRGGRSPGSGAAAAGCPGAGGGAGG